MKQASALLRSLSRAPRRYALLGLVLLSGTFVLDDITSVITAGSLVTPAQAIVGRPATPGSVAGVARRTTRRAYRRHHVY